MHALAKVYQLFIYFGKIIQPIFLLGLRLYWGWLFFVIGVAKLGSMQQTIETFQALPIGAPEELAYTVAIIETVGGIFLFFGFLARMTSILLVAIMLGALSVAHLQPSLNVLAEPMVFIAQMPVTFLLASLVVMCFGPGIFSIDAIFKRALLGKTSSSHDHP